ncbi:Nitrous oxidase accessory protein NosD, contains tandem CASH domains [Halogranum rubrum]|uniref:Nitrous oxidase accessory protein NosD, contains tandem CASH domains n=2 Tax=Halogranum rubrum TaxID=553466 RepID=A0A1I4EM00_9EURY|nr:Nitrous oxidase accessory protein NosD, contains tandem CASH domains [Halogranum rubrum]
MDQSGGEEPPTSTPEADDSVSADAVSETTSPPVSDSATEDDDGEPAQSESSSKDKTRKKSTSKKSDSRAVVEPESDTSTDVESETLFSDGETAQVASEFELDSCGVIDQPGTYRLVSDLRSTDEICLDIDPTVREEIVIDGDGHVIRNDSVTTLVGISVGSTVTLVDMTIEGFDTAIKGEPTRLTLQRVRLIYNHIGVDSFANSPGSVEIRDSEILRNSFGVQVGLLDASRPPSVTVTRTTIVTNGLGVYSAGDLIVDDSTVEDNRIGLIVGTNGEVRNSVIRDNGQLGIRCGADFCELDVQNSLVSRNAVGISMSVGNLVGNEIDDNDIGIQLTDLNAANVRVVENEIRRNGIGLEFENRTFRDTDTVSEPSEVVLRDNRFVDNAQFGVLNERGVVIDARGNFWGDTSGPSSGPADDPDAPFTDPVTGRLAEGTGDSVSENPTNPGISNVRFDGLADSGPTVIDQCTEIDTPGEYVLGTTIRTARLTCIVIQSDDVVFDGKGRTVQNVDGFEFADGVEVDDEGGVSVDSRQVTSGLAVGPRNTVRNVVIRDVVVDGFEVGVRTGAHPSEATFESVTAVDNEVGVLVGPTVTSTYLNGTFSNNTVGMSGIEYFPTAVVDTRITDNQFGAYFESGRVSISSTTFDRNADRGLTCRSCVLTMEDSTVSRTSGTGVVTSTNFAENVIRNSTIVDNGFGVDNRGTTLVDARGNFWGDESGPSSVPADDPDAPFADPVTGTLADGTGDAISEDPSNTGVSNVRFDPFVGDTNEPTQFSRDDIAQAKYGRDFDELSVETTGQVQAIFNRQPFPDDVSPADVETREEIAERLFDLSLDESDLSERLTREQLLTVQNAYDEQFGSLPTDPAFSRDDIAQAKYDRDFDELSVETAGQVQAIFNRQSFPAGVSPADIETREEIAERLFGVEVEESTLAEVLTKERLADLQNRYDAQFESE